MSREKGSPKTGGRKKGTPNKITGTLREFLSNMIDNNRDQIECDLQRLPPKDRLLIIERFMQYVIPKQKELYSTIEEINKDKSDIDFSFISEDMLFEIADQIQNARYESIQKAKRKD